MTYMKYKNARGQTLIETVVAIFILVMGMTAAVGLAIYAFAGSTSVTKQIIATGLAREGIEAIKNMRDTNWLKDSLSSDCYNFQTTANNGKCYKDWLTQENYPSLVSGGINPPSSPRNYVLGMTTSFLNPNYWILYQNGAFLYCPFPFGGSNSSPRYGLDFSSNPASENFLYGLGFYRPNCSTQGSSSFYRKIILEKNTTAPFNQSNLEQLQVTVQVWWTDKKCPRKDDWPGKGKCSLELKTNLTNWRNY